MSTRVLLVPRSPPQVHRLSSRASSNSPLALGRNRSRGGSSRGSRVTRARGKDLFGGVLGSDHDDGLRVAGGQVRVDRRVNDKQVVSAVHLGVEVHDAGAVAASAVVDSHLGASDPVVSADHLGSNDFLGGGTGGDIGESRVAAAGEIQPPLDKVGHGLAVLLVDEPGLGVEDSVAGSSDTELTDGGGSVGQEGADSDDARGHGTGCALEVTNTAVGALGRSPKMHALSSLSDGTRSLEVQVQVRLNGVGGDAVEVVGREVGLGVELKHNLGVVLEVVANRQVNPAGLGGKSHTSSGSSLLDNGQGVRLADTCVPEKTGGRHGTSSEDNLAALVDLDDLPAAVGGLCEDTSNLATSSKGLNDLGLKLESKVGQVLGERNISASRAGTLIILDGPRRAGVDVVLVVRLFNRVNFGPSLGVKEALKDLVSVVIVVLAVGRRLGGAGVALIQTRSSLRHVTPVPSSRPTLPVMLRRVDEVKSIDRRGASQETAGSGSSVAAELGAGQAGHAAAKGGNIVGGQRIIPGQGLSSVSESNCVGRTALNQENADALLSKSLSGDDTGRATTNNDGIIGLVGGSGKREGAVSRDCAVTTAVAGVWGRNSLSSPRSPQGILGRLGGIDVNTELTKASSMVGESTRRVRGVGRVGLGDGPSENRRFGVDACLALNETPLAKEGVRDVGAVDEGTVGNGQSLDLGFSVNIGVGVRSGDTERCDDVLAINPSDKEETSQHAATERDSTPSFLVGTGSRDDHLADKVRADSLGKGDTEAVAGAKVLLKVDAGVGIGMRCGSQLSCRRSDEPKEGRHAGEIESHGC